MRRQLAMWLSLFAVAGGSFVTIAYLVTHGGTVTRLDLRVSAWFHAHTTQALTPLMLLVTNAHDTIPMTILTLLLAGFFAWRRDGYRLLCVALCMPLGQLLNVAMKHAFERPRPSSDQAMLVLQTYSFPSGHVAGATLFYGLLVAILLEKFGGWRAAAVVLAGFVMVALVALTRVYLGVHYLSDVVAAFAEELAWLALCFTGLRAYLLYVSTKNRSAKNVLA